MDHTLLTAQPEGWNVHSANAISSTKHVENFQSSNKREELSAELTIGRETPTSLKQKQLVGYHFLDRILDFHYTNNNDKELTNISYIKTQLSVRKL